MQFLFLNVNTRQIGKILTLNSQIIISEVLSSRNWISIIIYKGYQTFDRFEQKLDHKKKNKPLLLNQYIFYYVENLIGIYFIYR